MSIFTWTGASSSVYSTAGNFTPSGPATTGDTLIHNQLATAALAASDESSRTLAQWLIQATNTQTIGDNGTPFKIKSTMNRIGDLPLGSLPTGGSGRINIDFSTAAMTLIVASTSTSPTDAGKEPVRIKAVNSSNLAVVQSGLVGFATDSPGDVATFSEIAVTGDSGIVNIASGVTLATLVVQAGQASLGCAATTIRLTGGQIITQGSGAVTTATIGGAATLNSTGTVGTLIVVGGGVADFSQDLQAKTITLCKLFKGSTLIVGSHITITTLQLIECDLGDISIVSGGNLGVAISYL